MVKVIDTYIAGVNYNNEDGSSRKEILNDLPSNYQFVLENFYFEEEKAVKILTKDNKCVGYIPRTFAEEVFDYNQRKMILDTLYTPVIQNDLTRYNIKIYIRKLLSRK